MTASLDTRFTEDWRVVSCGHITIIPPETIKTCPLIDADYIEFC